MVTWTLPDPGPAAGSGVTFAQLSTVRVGGPVRRLIDAADEQEAIEAVRAADAHGEPALVIGSGSNLVVCDEGFDGTVVRLASRGVALERAAGGGRVRLRVAAGEPWDELVARAVEERLAGIECLSGIPGLAGATPIQNVGAYGQQVSDTLVSVRAYDRMLRRVVELPAADCRLGYRTSALRRGDRRVVLEVTFELERSPLARPLRYEELAAALDAAPGDRPSLSQVREAVLALRRRKGMVPDPDDPDTVSVGSFFVNPVLKRDELESLTRRARALANSSGRGPARDAPGHGGPPGWPRSEGRPSAWAQPEGRPPAWPQPDGRVRTSAAWLIERAGFRRGQALGRAAISTKHTLALVNRGGASARELIELARVIRDGVREAFGVTLEVEPTLVGLEL